MRDANDEYAEHMAATFDWKGVRNICWFTLGMGVERWTTSQGMDATYSGLWLIGGAVAGIGAAGYFLKQQKSKAEEYKELSMDTSDLSKYKPIPDFGTDRGANDKRDAFIRDNADYFTVFIRMYGERFKDEFKTLEAARAKAKEVYDSLAPEKRRPLLIYAVYGIYQAWVENYDGKETTS